MDKRRELGEFLARRRGQVSPENAPIPAVLGTRRVPGLRREEVALLAGISTTYYTRLERGKVGGISDSVLHGLVDALQLSPQEADYIAATITVSGWVPGVVGAASETAVPPALQRLLDSSTLPLLVLNERCDYVAHNRSARALYAHHFPGRVEDRGGAWDPSTPVNSIEFLFLDPRARSFYVDWERAAFQGVAYLRASAARHPGDRGLAELIATLRSASDEFDAAWASRDVHFDPEGTRGIEHPEVGRLDVDYQTLLVVGHPSLRMTSYTAPEGSATAERLALLAAMRP